MAKEMLINVSEGEECRIALLENGRLEELYMERTSSTSHVGNIYKGKVTNVEASIQAAFVDFGLGRNGFLHISDLMPTYFGRMGDDIRETVGKKMARRDRPPIQRCLRRGDEIIVQIIKEGIGTKGPTLSSYLSIPGKFLVMMPGVGKMGVSQKIEDEVERRRLRQILDGLKPPKDVGFIIRTAGVGKSKMEIERDLKYLTRLWETLEKKRLAAKGAAELYAEGDLVTRTVRDFFTADIDRIIVDSEDVAERVREVIKITTPRTKNRVELYDEPVPLFHKFGIEREIELMYSRHVPLPSGGSLVIDSTEAIVAIDVNSGKFREHNDAELTAFKTDMEAADEIPRQLKLRDLGGVIICDFIDLRYERHRRELEKKLHDAFKNDRAKTKVLRMSQFGIIEMTRQRMRPSLKRSIYFDCPHCKGAGLVKTPESMSLDVMRRIAIAINDLKVARVELGVCPDIAFYLQNKKRMQLADLERHYNKRVLIRSDQTLGLDEMRLELFDMRDGLVMLPELDAALSQPPHKSQLNTRPHGQPAQQGRGGPAGGGGQGNAGGRFDGRRRDQGRRGPQPAGQQPQRGGGRPQGGARDEDDTRLDERFDYDDDEQDTQDAPPPRPAAAAADDRGERDDRSERDDRGRQPSGAGPRDQRDQRGQRDQRDLPPRGNVGNGPQRNEQRNLPGDRGGPRDRNQQQPPRGPQQQQNRGGRGERDIVPAPGGGQPPQNRAPGVAGRGDNGPAGQGGEGQGGEGEDGGPRRRRRRRRGRRGRGRGPDQQNDQGLPQGEGQGEGEHEGEGEGQFAPVGNDADHDDQHEGEGDHARAALGEHDDHDEDESHEFDHDRHAEPVDHSEPLGEAPREITDDDDDDDDDHEDHTGGETIRGEVIEIVEVEAPAHDDEDEADDEDLARHEPETREPEPVAAEPAAEPEPVAEEKPARGRRRSTKSESTGRGTRKTPASKAPAKAPAASKVSAAAAPADDDESGDAAGPKKRRRGTRGGRGRGKKPSAGEAKGGEAAAGSEATPAAAIPPASRRASTDRHLMNEDLTEPDPEPVRRPRSSRDLDDIPDDLD